MCSLAESTFYSSIHVILLILVQRCQGPLHYQMLRQPQSSDISYTTNYILSLNLSSLWLPWHFFPGSFLPLWLAFLNLLFLWLSLKYQCSFGILSLDFSLTSLQCLFYLLHYELQLYWCNTMNTLAPSLFYFEALPSLKFQFWISGSLVNICTWEHYKDY